MAGVTRSARLLSALAPIVLVPALAGCAKTLDVDKAEKTIGADYARQIAGADVRSVTCPDDVSADIGTKATCTMVLARDVRLTVALEVTGEDGKLRWTTVSGTLPGTLLEQRAKDALEARVGRRPDSVDCPARVNLKVGSTTRCTLTSGDQSFGATVTITDDDGGFDIDVDEQPLT